MEPAERSSDYAPNQRAFEARNRLNRVFFAIVRQELEEASIHPNYEEQWREREEEDDFFCGVPAWSNKAMLGLHVPGVGESTEQECLVCLEDFKEGDKAQDDAMFPFLSRALYFFRWLCLGGVCPCCRFALPSTHEQRLLDEQAARLAMDDYRLV